MIVGNDDVGSHTMKGKASQKFDVDGAARYISGRYGSIADDPHTAIQKEYHGRLFKWSNLNDQALKGILIF